MDRGGMMNCPQGMRPHWLFYFVVTGLDAAIGRIEHAGGKIVHGRHGGARRRLGHQSRRTPRAATSPWSARPSNRTTQPFPASRGGDSAGRLQHGHARAVPSQPGHQRLAGDRPGRRRRPIVLLLRRDREIPATDAAADRDRLAALHRLPHVRGVLRQPKAVRRAVAQAPAAADPARGDAARVGRPVHRRTELPADGRSLRPLLRLARLHHRALGTAARRAGRHPTLGGDAGRADRRHHRHPPRHRRAAARRPLPARPRPPAGPSRSWRRG